MNNNKNSRWVTGGLIVGMIVLVAVVFVSFRDRLNGSADQEVVATVNNEPITRETFNTLKQIPKIIGSELGQAPPVMSDFAILNELIDDILLAQSGREAGIEISDDDLKGEIAIFLASLGTTPDEFESLLIENGVSWNAFVESVETTLIADRYVEEELLSRIPDADRTDFLNSWLIVQKQESDIVIEPDFLEEINAQ